MAGLRQPGEAHLPLHQLARDAGGLGMGSHPCNSSPSLSFSPLLPNREADHLICDVPFSLGLFAPSFSGFPPPIFRGSATSMRRKCEVELRVFRTALSRKTDHKLPFSCLRACASVHQYRLSSLVLPVKKKSVNFFCFFLNSFHIVFSSFFLYRTRRRRASGSRRRRTPSPTP